MPPWLSIWIARWSADGRATGETSGSDRFRSGAFFISGMLMMFMITAGRQLIDHASIFVVWPTVTTVMGLGAFGMISWARRVPATVSLLLGFIVWFVLAWLATRPAHAI